MKKIFNLILVLLFISNCSLNKVVKHHGVHFLEKKQEKLNIDLDNKNDIKKKIGPPSTISTFDNDMWIYIERKTTTSEIKKFGRTKLLVNNVLFLEFDNRGMLVKKTFYDKNKMNEIEVTKDETTVIDKKNTFINSVLRTLKKKINDPLGKRTIE